MQQLTGLDAAFLAMETANATGHVGGVCVLDPRDAPIWMIGPSRPTAEPLPIASADASDFTAATTGRIRPSL